MIPIESQQWIAATVQRGQFATIPASEGGSHFAFWENPDRFSDPDQPIWSKVLFKPEIVLPITVRQ
jgi:hypothetical protein